MSGKRSDRIPWIKFFPQDWLSSTQISMMTPAEEGAYIRLLCHAWADKNCSIPDDGDALATLSRLGETWHTGSGQKLLKNFQKNHKFPGKLFNTRLLQEKTAAEKYIKQQRLSGLRGSEKRWGHHSDPTTDANRLGIPSQSQSQKQQQKKKKRREDVFLTALDLPSDREKPNQKKINTAAAAAGEEKTGMDNPTLDLLDKPNYKRSLKILQDFGLDEETSSSLALDHSLKRILIVSKRAASMKNPAGFIRHTLEKNSSVPGFLDLNEASALASEIAAEKESEKHASYRNSTPRIDGEPEDAWLARVAETAKARLARVAETAKARVEKKP